MAPTQICQCNRGSPLGVSSNPPALSAGACLHDGREPTGNRPTLHRPASSLNVSEREILQSAWEW
jgi:hypothetical protein